MPTETDIEKLKSPTSKLVRAHYRHPETGMPVDATGETETKATTLDEKLSTEAPVYSMAVYAEA